MSKAAAKWQYFRDCKPQKRKKLLKKDFAFRIDDIGAGWEYIHFELGGETVSSFRVSYIGSGVRSFAEESASMKEKENNLRKFMKKIKESRKLIVYLLVYRKSATSFQKTPLRNISS